MSHTVAGGVLAFLLPVVVGVIAGAIVGALLASRIRSRGPRAARAGRPRSSSRPDSMVARDDQGGEGGRWLLARYRGRCDRCRATITPGDRIRHSPGRNACERCGIEGAV
jgi:hypothetical protein